MSTHTNQATQDYVDIDDLSPAQIEFMREIGLDPNFSESSKFKREPEGSFSSDMDVSPITIQSEEYVSYDRIAKRQAIKADLRQKKARRVALIKEALINRPEVVPPQLRKLVNE